MKSKKLHIPITTLKNVVSDMAINVYYPQENINVYKIKISQVCKTGNGTRIN
jgi:hypothetical protein